MADSKNSRNSRRFNGLLKSPVTAVTLSALACGALMASAAVWFYRTGATLWYGDAEAHLNIARRVFDSRSPGLRQLGTTWLPLPHLAMIPFARNDELWKSGLAGAIPAAIAMALAGVFFFAATHRALASTTAAAAAVAVFLLNPNTLYLGSIPMSEPYFYAAFFALLYFTVRFGETKGWGALVGAAVAASIGALARYEGWFVIPFAALYVLALGRGVVRRGAGFVVFCVVAGIGPALWLAHNRWNFGDALYFYGGPWSAAAIQGNTNYPGRGDWHAAMHYFFEAGKLFVGLPALLLGAAGAIAALIRRAVWPVILLALLPVFYVWSMHSSSTPVFVPTLWPFTFYNLRYAMAWLPLAALGIGAIARFGKIPAVVGLAVAFSPVILHPASHAVTWQESNVNSLARREWIGQAVAWLRPVVGPHETFFTSFGDMTAIYRTLGIPLRDTLTGDNDLEFDMACRNPQVFLHTDWAVATGGDAVQTVVDRARRDGPRYELQQRVTVNGEPALEIFRRVYDPPPEAPEAPIL